MDIVVREARADDKPAIMQFASRTWNWGDYIPDVWDTWYNERSGRIFVAEFDGKPIGMNHVRYLDEGVGWLEGVRVHPEFRRRGVATALGEYAIRYVKRLGARRIRLISAIDNKPAHRQIARMGMQEICHFSILQCGKAIDSGEHVDILNDYTKAWNLIKNTEEYEGMKGFFGDRWAMRSIEEYGVKRLIDEGRIYYLEKDGFYSIAIGNIDSFGNERFGQISFIGGTGEAVDLLARWLTNSFFSGSISTCYMFLPYGMRKITLPEYNAADDMILFEL